MKTITHYELCEKASKWLKERGRIYPPTCPFTVIEKKSAAKEIPDVYGWNYCTSVVVEIKVSRSDFLSDRNKVSRIEPSRGIGEHRYYCCPIGIISEVELPENWGLLVLDNGKIKKVKTAETQNANYKAETYLLKSIIREIQNG